MTNTSLRSFRATVDLRSRFKAVQNQGDRPTCVAFAATACNEVVNNKDKLSEEFLYRCCKLRDGNQNDGTHVHVALNNLAKIGQVTELEMPYILPRSVVIPNQRISLRHFRNARGNRIHQWRTDSILLTMIERYLQTDIPVIAVVEVQDSFYQANTTHGFIDAPVARTFRDAYHAVVIVGYGVDSRNSPYYVIRNSWGDKWGDSGYGYLSYTYFQMFGSSVWIVR